MMRNDVDRHGTQRSARRPRRERRPRSARLLALMLGAVLVAPVAARAETDFLELRERLEVNRATLRDGLSKFRRAPEAAQFPTEKPGTAFRKYVDLALRAVEAPTRFPEVQAALGKFNGRLDAADPTARQALGVLLGDYLQVRYGDDIVRELGTLVGFKTFNTIVDRNSENAEFRKSFDWLARLASDLGLQVQNHGYETLAITLPGGAAGAPPLGVWTHVDVPRPVAQKWLSPPWELAERDNRLHGAGVFDDKGPLVVNLFALRVLRDAGLQLARPVVLLVSANGEELGAEAATDIARVAPPPALVLAADGSYPYGTRELGRLVARVSSSRGMKSQAGIRPGEYLVHKMTGGQGLNTVPSEARIWVRYEPPANEINPALVQTNKWRAELEAYQKGHTHSVYETFIQEDTLHFFVYGRATQTMRADEAVNSFYDAAGHLQRLAMFRNSASDVLQWIAAGLAADPTGKSIGLAFEHPEMGGTWVNPVAFDRLGDEVTVLVDVRWPLGHDAAWIRERLTASVRAFNAKHGTKLEVGWEGTALEPVESLAPRAVREALDEAYALASGEGASPAPVTPSCARLLPAAIPFGPQRPRGEPVAHMRDEGISPRELQDIGVATLAALAALGTGSLPQVPEP